MVLGMWLTSVSVVTSSSLMMNMLVMKITVVGLLPRSLTLSTVGIVLLVVMKRRFTLTKVSL